MKFGSFPKELAILKTRCNVSSEGSSSREMWHLTWCFTLWKRAFTWKVKVPITPRIFFSFPSSRVKISGIVLLQFLIWSIRFKDISLQILQEIVILNIPLEISANCIEPGNYMMWRSLRDGIFSVTVFLLYKLSSKRQKY